MALWLELARDQLVRPVNFSANLYRMAELPTTPLPRKIGHLLVGETDKPQKNTRVVSLHTASANETDPSLVLFSGPLDSPIDEDAIRRTERWLVSGAEELRIVERAALRNLTPFLTSWATARAAPALRIARYFDDCIPQTVTLRNAGSFDELLTAYFASRAIPCSTVREKAMARSWHLQKADWSAFFASKSRHKGGAEENLLATFHINSSRTLLPIARRLQELGVRSSLLVMPEDRLSRDLLSEANLDAVTLSAPTDPRILGSVSKALLTLRGRLSADLLRDWGESMEIPGWALSRSSLTALSRRLLRHLFRSLHASMRIDATLTELAPASVTYVTHRAIFDELLCNAHPEAKRFLVLQGVVPDIPPLHTNLDVDRAIVGSSLDIPYLKRCGIPESRWVISGYPGYDHFETLNVSECRRELADSGWIQEDSPLIIFTSQYVTGNFPDSARMANLHALVRAARSFPEYRFVIRPHPRREIISRELLDALPENVRVSTGGDTARWLKAADLVVTYWSTTAIEALLLGTRLIQLNATGLPDYLQLPTKFQVPVARSSSQLCTLIRDEFWSRTGRARSKPVAIAQLDGGAATRAAAAIHRALLDERTASP